MHFFYWSPEKEEKSLKNTLERLIDLQRIDSELIEIKNLRGDLPVQVDRLNKDIEELENTLIELGSKSQAYKKEHGISEMEIKALEGKQKKYQMQLFEVKTNREYDAVTKEIESVKANISKKESRLLELMDLEEEIQKAIKDTKEKLGVLQEKLKGRKGELNQRMEKTEKDELILEDKRQKIVRDLTPRILGTYERIRKAKHGLAVVPVMRNACGGCFKTLPPQRILEIRDMERLHVCEVCGRILVWDEKKSELTEKI